MGESGKPTKPGKYIVGLPVPGAAGILISLVVANHAIAASSCGPRYVWAMMALTVFLELPHGVDHPVPLASRTCGSTRARSALVFFAVGSSAIVSLQTKPAFVLVWLLSFYVRHRAGRERSSSISPRRAARAAPQPAARGSRRAARARRVVGRRGPMLDDLYQPARPRARTRSAAATSTARPTRSSRRPRRRTSPSTTTSPSSARSARCSSAGTTSGARSASSWYLGVLGDDRDGVEARHGAARARPAGRPRAHARGAGARWRGGARDGERRPRRRRRDLPREGAGLARRARALVAPRAGAPTAAARRRVQRGARAVQPRAVREAVRRRAAGARGDRRERAPARGGGRPLRVASASASARSTASRCSCRSGARAGCSRTCSRASSTASASCAKTTSSTSRSSTSRTRSPRRRERGEPSAAATLAREASEYARVARARRSAARTTSIVQAELWRQVAASSTSSAARRPRSRRTRSSRRSSRSARSGSSRGSASSTRSSRRWTSSRRARPLRARRPALRRRARRADRGRRPCPPHLRQDNHFPDVWHVDVIEWEQQGSAAEACADVLLDKRWPDLIRRKAMLARLTAFAVEGRPATTASLGRRWRRACGSPSSSRSCSSTPCSRRSRSSSSGRSAR